MLQLAPVARTFFTLDVFNGATTVFKLILGISVVLGSVDAVSGSSTVIDSPGTATGTNGVPFNYQITTFPYPFTKATATPLPNGLSCDLVTGLISGTPLEEGTWNVLLWVNENDLPERTTTTNLTLTILPFVPGIVTPPQSIIANTNSSVTFSVSAIGAAPLTYQWQKNNVNVSGATGPTLTLTANNTTIGSYKVIITNSKGTVTSDPVTLVLATAPKITKQPVSQTAVAGSGVSFSVNFTGIPTPNFQWKKDNVIIPGANASSYSIASVSSSDASKYSVSLVNMAGSVNSSQATLGVLEPPTFTLQPTNQYVNLGDPVSFVADAFGSPAPTYQWQLNGVDIDGAIDLTYSIAAITPADIGDYTITASSLVGSTVSQIASLILIEPLTIVTQPVGVKGKVGDAASFSVAATGVPAPYYQWYFNSNPIQDATNNVYNITSIANSDVGNYYVIVSNIISQVTSDTVSLSTGTTPVITQSPVSQSAIVGSSVTFSVIASGDPAPSYDWKKNGVSLGLNSSSITLNNVTDSDSGSYIVTVSNSSGSVDSSLATLSILHPVNIINNPSSQNVKIGNPVTFSVSAIGDNLSYQWHKNGSDISGANNADLQLRNVSPSDEGQYYVTVFNGFSTSDSTFATLSVFDPVNISTQPQSQTAFAGVMITFNVVATGYPKPTYQWYKDNIAIGGETSSSLNINSISFTDIGFYTVSVSNDSGTVISSPAALSVLPPLLPPVITSQPVGSSAIANQTPVVTFSVGANGNPSPLYQWKKNGVDIGGAIGNVYQINNPSLSDSGNYSVRVYNSEGFVVSDIATLIVSSAPTIVTGPVSQTVEENSPVSFSVVANGTPNPTYQWQKSGVNISGATSPTLTIASVTSSDAGDYTVVVSNPVSSVTSDIAHLTVNIAAPTIRFDRIENCCREIAIFTLTGPPNAEISVFSSPDLDNWVLLVKIKLSSEGKAEYADLSAKGNPTRMYKATLP